MSTIERDYANKRFNEGRYLELMNRAKRIYEIYRAFEANDLLKFAGCSVTTQEFYNAFLWVEGEINNPKWYFCLQKKEK